jgi:GTP-binding protein
LHVVDVALINEQFNPAQAVLTVAGELERFSPELADRERWLVCNKIDLLTPEEREDVRQGMVERLQWRGPTFVISAATGEGVGDLVNEVMAYLESRELESHTTG